MVSKRGGERHCSNTENTLTIRSASSSRVRPKGSFLYGEDPENLGWKNGMNGWCGQTVNQGVLHPEASLLSEGAVCLHLLLVGQSWETQGKDRTLSRVWVTSIFAPGVPVNTSSSANHLWVEEWEFRVTMPGFVTANKRAAMNLTRVIWGRKTPCRKGFPGTQTWEIS